MDQHLIYRVLGESQSKIYSFEDYPALKGSWRTSFFCNGYVCEIRCNRNDKFMELKATKTNSEDKTYKLNWSKFVGDEFELNYIKKWLHGLFEKD